MELNNNIVKKKQTKVWKWAGQVDILICALVGLVAGGCFINSLNGDFVHDDIFAIKNNPDVTGQNEWTQLFANDFWGKSMSDNTSHKSYRPLTVLSFRLDYYLSEGGSPWFHVVNIILHALVSALFTFTCQRVFHVSSECSAITGLLFALHPVHSEAVAGIVGRAELLAAIFFLLALISYCKSIDISSDGDSPDFPVTQHPQLLVAMAACTVAAMLCKEQGLTVLGVCAIIDVTIICRKGVIRLLNERDEKTLMRMSPLMGRLLVIIITMLSLMVFRLWIMVGNLPEFQEQDNPASFSPHLVTRVLSYNYLFAYNSWLLLAPITLCYDWTLGSIPLVESFTDPCNLATVLFYIVLLMMAYKCFQDFTSQDDLSPSIPIVAMSLLVIPFLPASNIFFRVGFVVAERVLYLPSLGFSLLVGQGVSLLLKRLPYIRQNLLTVLVVYLAVLGTKTWTQNKIWLSREALFRSGVATLPENAKVHYNYANYLRDIGANDQAVWHYRKSLELYPHHASVCNNLGTLLANHTEAEVLYRRALEIYPDHKGAYINLGQLLFNGGKQEIGVRMVEKSLEIDSGNTDALLTMGKMMMDQHRWSEAEHFIKKAIDEKPTFAKAYNYYGVFLLHQGHVADAVTYYQRAYSLDNHDTIAMANAADGLRKLGRLQEAEELLRHSHRVRPDIKTLDQLAMLYFQAGQTGKAAGVYEEMMEQNQNNTDVLIHYANVLMKQNELSKADLYLMRVLSQNPSHLDALRGAGSIAGATKRYKEAIYYLREALAQATMLKKEPSFQAVITYDLGNLYKDIKELDIAEEYYHQTLRLDPSKSKAHLNLGAIYHLAGKFVKARHHYEEVLKLDPHDELVQQNLVKLGRLEHKQTDVNKHGKR